MEFPTTKTYKTALPFLLELFRDGGFGAPTPEDVKAWGSEDGLTLWETFDRVATELAMDFALGALSWDFCDWAANRLNGTFWQSLSEGDDISGSQFDEFYLAFDASEGRGIPDAHAKALEGILGFLGQQDIVINR